MKKAAAIFLCDYSGIMARPWARAGVTCICLDLQHSIYDRRNHKRVPVRFESGGEIYFEHGDARSWKPTDFMRDFFLHFEIVFVCAFPVCTDVAVSGSQYFEIKGLARLSDALLLFNACESVAAWSGAPYCIENPVGVLSRHHRQPDYYFHPWFYGDLWTKKTCLWTGNGFIMPVALDYLTPVEAGEKILYMSPGPNRQNLRSETPGGFAEAVFGANWKG